MKKYIERGGWIERVWQVWYEKNGFKFCILVQGTEYEVHDYLNSELGYMGGYSAMSDAEIGYAKALRIPIYIAPQTSFSDSNYYGD